MAGNKKIYSLDEYYKDKYGAQTAMSPLDRAGSQSPGSVRPVSAVHAGSTQRRQQFLRSMNVTEKLHQTTEQTQTTPDTAGGIDTTSLDNLSPEGGALTEKEFNSKLTTADTMRMLEDALASLAEWGNRKFVYNAKESPLYTILQQQAEKEARLASGRAYSRAVANTGGFGSSYATLAAEEAGRQVMEGLDDQQLALYQAAREEFEAERQSRVDWYNTAKQLHNDRMALDELQAIEAAAKAAGMNTDTYNLLQTAVAEDWYDGTNKATVRHKLETMALGNPNINVDAIMTQLEGGQKAQMTDLVSDLSINPTLSGAAEIMAQAKVNGTEAEVLPQVSAYVSKGFIGALENPSLAYGILGVEPEEWNAMFAEYTDPDERAAAQKAYVLDAAGEARKRGMLSGDDYMNMLIEDVDAELAALPEHNYDNPISDIANIVIGMQNYRDSGYISEDEYENMLDLINGKTSATKMLNNEGTVVSLKAWAKYIKTIAGEEIMGVDVDDIMRWSEELIDSVTPHSGNTWPYAPNDVGVLTYAGIYSVSKDLRNLGFAMTEDQQNAYGELIDREAEAAIGRIASKGGRNTAELYNELKDSIYRKLKEKIKKAAKPGRG